MVAATGSRKARSATGQAESRFHSSFELSARVPKTDLQDKYFPRTPARIT
jgi:hypothetical protein